MLEEFAILAPTAAVASSIVSWITTRRLILIQQYVIQAEIHRKPLSVLRQFRKSQKLLLWSTFFNFLSLWFFSAYIISEGLHFYIQTNVATPVFFLFQAFMKSIALFCLILELIHAWAKGMMNGYLTAVSKANLDYNRL